LYYSPGIIRVIKSKKYVMCAGHVAYMGEMRNVYMVLWRGDLKERDHLNDLGIDGRIILKGILKT